MRTAAKLIGKEVAAQVEQLSLDIYLVGSEYAHQRGIIVADTKFEFGIDNSTSPPSIVLIVSLVNVIITFLIW